MSNVYTKNLNVPPIARNKRIYTGTTSITNNTVTNSIEDQGGISLPTIETLLNTRQVKHGFESIGASILSFDNSTRYFTITGTDFPVWNIGTKFLRDTEEIIIDDVDGLWYIYYDENNEILASQTIWDLDMVIPIAIVDWDATLNQGNLKDERRSCFDINHVRLVRDRQLPHPAEDIYTDTSNFDNKLSSSDDTVQKALETLDGTISDQSDVDVNMSGFLNQTETTIAFDGTNLFTLAPVGATWNYYRAGIRRTITGSKTVELPGTPVTTGLYYIYIDDDLGTLTASTSVWSLLDNKIPVADILFNDTLTPKFHIGDERHTILIHRRNHYLHHVTEGSKMASMGALTGYTLNSDVNANKTFAIADSTMLDEDIIHDEDGLTQPDGTATDYVVFYRTGASTWLWKKSNMPFIYNVGNTNNWIQWDNAGTMTDATGGGGALTRWINTFLCVTNIEGDGRFVIIPGRAAHNSLALADAEAVPSFKGLGITEGVVTYRLTWSTLTSTSQGKCILTKVTSINTPILSNPVSASSIVHNSLAGLQGGSDTERYHLTDAQVTLLDGLRNEDQKFQYKDIEAGVSQTYVLDSCALYAYTIESLNMDVDTGTLTGIAIKINATAVTSLSSVTATATNTTTSATAAKTVAIGDRVILVTSTGYTGMPTMLIGKINIKRT